MRLTGLFRDFFNSEKTGGFILIACMIISLLVANSAWSDAYISFWNLQFSGHTITHWINDGLMTIFFLLIGLELERELYKGELSSLKNALLPVIAAVGGILVPALFYSILNFGKDTASGFGIPMATDIAFAIGILSLLGNKVPPALKIFLTALAVIDDLASILIIAIFYSSGIVFLNLALALSCLAILFVFNRLKIHRLWIYLSVGIVMWYLMLSSGIHPTITGVLLAFVIPFGSGDKKTASYRLQHMLHRPVSFLVLPIFALANTAIAIPAGWVTNLANSESVGIILGLVAGKPIGILLFSATAVATGICALPNETNWKQIAGAGILAGIGFTMSIFITLLAFTNDQTINAAKIAIVIASFIATILGVTWLSIVLKKNKSA